MPSPDFVMPDPPDGVQTDDGGARLGAEGASARAPGAPEAAARETDPTAPSEHRARARRPWAQLAAAALVGVLVGAGIPSIAQALERAAADDRAERLRATAMEYLLALEGGDADRASAMVPLDAPTTGSAVLQAAERLEQPEIRLVAIDGEAATVEVRYRVASRTVTRSLAADEVDGEWQLRTSLAERVAVYGYGGVHGVTIAGVELPDTAATLLYPGRYTTDRVETPLLVSGGDALLVDGDPATPSDTFGTLELAPEVEGIAREVALTHVRMCTVDCAIAPELELRAVEGPWVMQVDAATGAVEMSVQLASRDAAGRILELHLRAAVDESGALASWSCGEPGRQPGALAPCRS